MFENNKDNHFENSFEPLINLVKLFWQLKLPVAGLWIGIRHFTVYRYEHLRNHRMEIVLADHSKYGKGD